MMLGVAYSIARSRRALAALAALAANKWSRISLGQENPYEVLGVSPSASVDEIRRAYKAKAAASHPDRGGNAEEFKRVAAAYAILSDPQAKARYDAGGGIGGSEGAPHGFGQDDLFDAFRLFEEFFQNGSLFEERVVARPRVVTLKLSLEELFQGGSRRVQFSRERACARCHGMGGTTERCSTCNGRGVSTTERRMGGFIQLLRSRCATCGGTGAVVTSTCYTCRGVGRAVTSIELDIQLPPGAADGDVLDFPAAGDDIFDGRRRAIGRRDLKVVVEQNDHPELQRLGPHLLVAKRVPLLDALTGFVLDLPCIATGGRFFVAPSLGLPARPDDVWVLRGAGMPASNHQRGDLYVRVIVDFPESMPSHPESRAKTRAALAACLGGDPELPVAPAQPRPASSFASLFQRNRQPASSSPPLAQQPRPILRATKSEVEALFRQRRQRLEASY